MAENVQETMPPEPPPKPPEVPKPTEEPRRAEAKDHGQPSESQQSAQQDARNAAQSEHAKATSGREPEGLQPTPEVQARLDAHAAATAERDTAAPQDSTGVARPRSQDSGAAQDSQDSGSASQPIQRSQEAAPAGEQADEPAVARRAFAAEQAEDTEDTALGEAPRPQPGQDDIVQPRPATGETATDAGDLARVGEGSGPWSDEGTNHREGGAVRQLTEGSCVSASREMLTDGRITQPELLSELGDWSNLSALRDELNSRDGDGTWTGHYFGEGSEALRRASEGPMAAQVQAPFGRAHMVMLEPGENGSFTVRDPYEGGSYDVDSSWVEKYVAGGVFR